MTEEHEAMAQAIQMMASLRNKRIINGPKTLAFIVVAMAQLSDVPIPEVLAILVDEVAAADRFIAALELKHGATRQ